MKISKEELLGIVRHGLTFIGGVILTGGLLDAGLWTEISGGVITLAGVIWSILNKRA
jgi:hypothetical protein